MSTQAAAILGGAIVAAALVFFAVSRVEPPDPDRAPAYGPDAATEAGGSAPPALDVPRRNEDVGRLMRELEAAKARIAELEQRHARAEPGAEPGGEATPAEKRAEVMDLVKAYATGTITREQIGRMMRLVKDKALMGRIVAGLQDRIAGDPDDLAARLQLAEVESARVHGAESITERALLAGNVREQLGEVLKRDPENWDARYMRAVGISHSQRTPQGRATAIREFESLIALQESRASEPRFAEAYGQLAEVYVAEKDVEKARAALERGLARYPDSEELRRRLEELGR